MIFLHSSFRTASTYVWSRVRREPGCVAYYEVFHEILASISQEQIGAMGPGRWDSKHPPGAPYFLEFLPLLQEGRGIRDFDPSLSYERFVPPSGPSGPVSDVEAVYVRGLIDHAERRGRIPVLSDTRSLGRVAGLKEAAPGLHAVLYRNLHQQWCSYTEQATCGNAFFLDTITKVVSLSRHDPVIRDLLELFPVERASATDPNTYYLFVFLHLHLYAHATAAADVMIDVNRLGRDAAYRTEIEAIFAAENVSVDLSDAQPSTAYSLVSFPCRASLLEQIRIVGDGLAAGAPSERGRVRTAQIIVDLIEEYERHEFYSRRLRSVMLSIRRERDEAAQSAKVVTQQLEEARNACDRVRAEKDAAAVAAADAEQETEAMRVERDRLRGAMDEAVRAVEEARRETGSLLGERDRLESEKDEALRLVEHGLSEVDALRSERDAAFQDRHSAESERHRLGQRLAASSDECERMADERDAARAAGDEAERERQRIAGRYDTLLRWSLAYHESTAASASWRLTRPLRWLGVGRPKRPAKPDDL